MDALRALRRLRRDADDPRAVSELLDSLDGPFAEGWFRRFRATRVGRRVLDERRDLLALLAHRSWLAALADDSLGRAYLDFADREGRVDAGADSAAGGYDAWRDDERERFRARLRDQHDLEHVVTGYGSDVLGETALLAFTLGQTASPGTAVLVALSLREIEPGQRRFLLEAYRRGRRSAWLPATDWETLLELPLDEVRAVLGLADPPIARHPHSRAAA